MCVLELGEPGLESVVCLIVDLGVLSLVVEGVVAIDVCPELSDLFLNVWHSWGIEIAWVG